MVTAPLLKGLTYNKDRGIIKMEESIRLQKYLANNGVASRRKCERYILDRKS